MKLGSLLAASAAAILVMVLGCQRTPEASSDAGVATGSTSSPAAAASSVAAPSPPATSAAPPPPASCDNLRKAVVVEAKSVAPCEKDENCTVHRSVLCALEELDCYAVHVNKERNPGKLDAAINAYAAQCPLSKCKCEVPGKSVCRGGMCAAE